MPRGAFRIETCRTCGGEFSGTPQPRNGNGVWGKTCPEGHFNTLGELDKTRNANRQASRHAVMSKVRTVGVASGEDALRLALAAMMGGYERLLATTPERSRAVIDGAFGKSPAVAKQILDAV